MIYAAKLINVFLLYFTNLNIKFLNYKEKLIANLFLAREIFNINKGVENQ